ncbi:MAG: phosphohydrolase [Anaerococcus sp.]|nr:phosphohydrolase [Anaerococcus sp.]
MYKEDYGNIPNKDKIISLLASPKETFRGEWIIHSYILGAMAKNMAKDLGLDPDIAHACGALAHIGKSLAKDGTYIIKGFNILFKESYFFPAKIALSHAFYHMDLASFGLLSDLSQKDRDFVAKFLYKKGRDPYSDLVYMMDKYLMNEKDSYLRPKSSIYTYDKEDLTKDLKALEVSLTKPISDYKPRLRTGKFPLSLFNPR